MWWLLITGYFFCAFQFKWIDPKTDAGWKIAAGVGYLVFFYIIRRMALWKAIERERNQSCWLLEEYQSKFGRGNDVRDVVSGFGEGFGESYSQVASESGDTFHALVGEGISFVSKFLAGATKSNEQVCLENQIQMLSDQIDAKEKLATRSMIMAVASAVILVWMSIQGRLPL